jgi:hypothetical protein
MESTADGSVAVGVLVGCGEGEAVGDVVAAGVAAPPQPPIARAVMSAKAVPRSKLIFLKTFLFSQEQHSSVVASLEWIRLRLVHGKGRQEGVENASIASIINDEVPSQISRT